MPDTLPIENDRERQEAGDFLDALYNAESAAPGWMTDGSGLSKVIARVEKAIDKYDKTHA